jgi:serine/threonine protein phosphatase PrpC
METPTAVPPSDHQHLCPSCGLRVAPRDVFCEACGRRLAAEQCTGCGATAIGEDGYCERCGLRRPGPLDHVETELPAAHGIAAGVSDRGLRHSRNEDAMALAAPAGRVLAVVCDGVSASPRPQIAARTAARTGAGVLAERLECGDGPERATLAAVAAAAEAVAALAGGDGAPACTYVSAVVGEDEVTVGWVGDSRAYWLAAGGTVGERARPSAALTIDDSWAAAMVARGTMSEAEAQADQNAHTLTGWLGADAGDVDGHVETFAPGGPGTVLLCSDGLWNYLPEATELAAELAASPATAPAATPAGEAPDAAGPPLRAARALVRTALDAGGRDNVTVVVIPFPSRPVPRPSSPPTAEPPN